MAFIVAAEDDADIADLIAAALSRAGHTVLVAPTGHRALELIAERRPDLVILDHRMPGMTGLDVARRLRADETTAKVPIMMLSANAPDGAHDLVDQVIRMPVSLAAVADAARDLIAGDDRTPDARPLTDPARLAVVSSLLGTPDPLDDLDLTVAAADVAAATGARIAAISLVLRDTTLTIASIGLPDPLADAVGMPVTWTPCAVVTGTDRAVVIPDLLHDGVYRSSPLTLTCSVRSYAGVPLRDPSGLVVGTLAAMDPDPIGFSTRTVRRMTAATPGIVQTLTRRRR